MSPEDPSLEDSTSVWLGARSHEAKAPRYLSVVEARMRTSGGLSQRPIDEATRRARLANALRAVSAKLAAVEAVSAAATQTRRAPRRTETLFGTGAASALLPVPEPQSSARHDPYQNEPGKRVASELRLRDPERPASPPSQPAANVEVDPLNMRDLGATLRGLRVEAAELRERSETALRSARDEIRPPPPESALAWVRPSKGSEEDSEQAWRKLHMEPSRPTGARARRAPFATEQENVAARQSTIHAALPSAPLPQSAAAAISATPSETPATSSEPEVAVTAPADMPQTSHDHDARAPIAEMVAELLAAQRVTKSEDDVAWRRPLAVTSVDIAEADSASTASTTGGGSTPAPDAMRADRGSTVHDVLSTTQDDEQEWDRARARAARLGGSMSDKTWRQPMVDEPRANRTAPGPTEDPRARARVPASSEPARRPPALPSQVPGASGDAPRRKPTIDVEAEWERALARARAKEVSPTVAKSRSNAAAHAASRATQANYARPADYAPPADYGARHDYAAELLEAETSNQPTAQGYRSPTAQPGYGASSEYEHAEHYAAEVGYDQQQPAVAYSEEAWDDPAVPIVSGQYAVPPGGYAAQGYAAQDYPEQTDPEQPQYPEQQQYPEQYSEQQQYPEQQQYSEQGYAAQGYDPQARAEEGYAEQAEAEYAEAEPEQAEAASEAEETAAQMYQLVERARASEARADDLERKLTQQQRQLSLTPAIALPSDDALSRRRSSGGWVGWAVAGVFAAAGVGGYFTAYAPMQGQLLAASKLSQQQAEANTEGVNALRAQFARERQGLEQQLAAAERSAQEAQTAAAAAPVVPEKAVRSAAAASPDDSDSDEPKELSASQQERRDARLAARETRKEEYEAKKAERLAAREAKKEERATKRSSAKSDDDEDDSSSTSKPTHASKSSPSAPKEASGGGSDDPLGGLDDL